MVAVRPAPQLWHLVPWDHPERHQAVHARVAAAGRSIRYYTIFQFPAFPAAVGVLVGAHPFCRNWLESLEGRPGRRGNRGRRDGRLIVQRCPSLATARLAWQTEAARHGHSPLMVPTLYDV